MLEALLAAGGWRAREAPGQYFYQDGWSGPADLRSRLLLALGDPLEAVDVPWDPTTLVMDFVVEPAAAGGGGGGGGA